MKITVVNNRNQAGNARLTLLCPHCRNQAVFEPLQNNPDHNVNNEHQVVGNRMCPNPECKGHVFVVIHGSTILATYPPSRIDFDTEGIPVSIVATLEEALTCEANDCNVASAIMVRRTLEEICADQEATGDNLKKRIENLGDKIVVPKALKEAMNELRLLGNDATHIEAKDYGQVSKNEVHIAIEFTKELLKAIYQYQSLLGKMLALKKKPAEQ